MSIPTRGILINQIAATSNTTGGSTNEIDIETTYTQQEFIDFIQKNKSEVSFKNEVM